jgi:two-component system OmpR family sensor kinase
MPRLPHSLRWRLQLWLALLLAFLLGGFGFAVWTGEKTKAAQRLDQELSAKAADIAQWVRGIPPHMIGAQTRGAQPPEPPPDDEFSDWFGDAPPEPPSARDQPGAPPGQPGTSGNVPPKRDTPETKRKILSSIEALEKQRPGLTAGAWLSRPREWISAQPAVKDFKLPDRIGTDTRGHWRTLKGNRVFHQYTEMGDAVLVAIPLHSAAEETNRLLLKLAGIAAVAFAIGLTVTGWIVDRSLRPIHSIAESAERVAAGKLSERMEVREPESELGQLSSVLNTTFTRLEASFEQQKRFVADASHELRTPLTVLITENQSALSRPRSAEEYREAVEENLRTAVQMKGLAKALLELARLDSKQPRTDRLTFELSELIQACANRLQTLAAKKGIALQLDLAEVSIHASPVRIRLVITNLLENAIHYTGEGGRIEITLTSVNDHCVLTVADNGCGIDPKHLPHIFERFYRADTSRTRGTGRYGLGLTICQGVVQAEQGEISVRSAPGQGTTFTVTLPRSPQSPDCDAGIQSPC